MPPIEKLSIKQLNKLVPYDTVFVFKEILEGAVFYQSDGGVPYKIEFHINEFSNLADTCTISDICAAIDESKYFGLSVSFG